MDSRICAAWVVVIFPPTNKPLDISLVWPFEAKKILLCCKSLRSKTWSVIVANTPSMVFAANEDCGASEVTV